jgi:protein-S-isoprenylcysteine O-methyltransferase Ste14
VARIPQLGRRGGGWVFVQFVLIGVAAAAGIGGPPWPDRWSGVRVGVGVALVLAGAAVGVLAARALGTSLTPFPHPSQRASLVAHGPYDLVRHPIYLGGLLFLSGVSLLLSPWALIVTGALGVVWALKARVEEGFLREHYPQYADYCRRTRYRLVPFVY